MRDATFGGRQAGSLRDRRSDRPRRHGRGLPRHGYAGWTVSKNKDRFLAVLPLDQGAQTPITVVTSWEAALKAR
jgi:hypothetical protein